MKSTTRTRVDTPRAVALAALLALFASLLAWGAVEPVAPLGLWETEDGQARVEIAPCGPDLCGTIVWLRDPAAPDGSGPKLDVFNPDPALRDQRILGLRILEGVNAKPDRDGRWKEGYVYDPNNGRRYRCYLELEADGRLKVRGYIGFSLLGRTTYWTRARD